MLEVCCIPLFPSIFFANPEIQHRCRDSTSVVTCNKRFDLLAKVTTQQVCERSDTRPCWRRAAASCTTSAASLESFLWLAETRQLCSDQWSEFTPVTLCPLWGHTQKRLACWTAWTHIKAGLAEVSRRRKKRWMDEEEDGDVLFLAAVPGQPVGRRPTRTRGHRNMWI